MYLALDNGLPRFQQGFTCPAVLRDSYQEKIVVSHTGLLPSMVFFPADSATTPFVNSWAGTHTDHKLPYNPTRATNAFLALAWFGLFPVRSPLLGESLLFSLPAGTKMFQFPALASATYVFSCRCIGTTRYGFPHSEISGSKLV